MSTVKLEYIDSIAILKFNRPNVLNSITDQLMIDARAALVEVLKMPHIRALVITGEGRGFCAGAELNDQLVNGNQNLSAGKLLNESMRLYINPLIQDLHDYPLPVIAAVNGVAAGAGVGLALAADITIATQSASFILTFSSKLGLIPDVGTTWHLSRRIGLARATALALMGNKLSANQAADWGLIWESVEDDQLWDKTLKIAKKLASSPRHAALELRKALHHAQMTSLIDQLDYERIQQCLMVEKSDFREGVNAFNEKRDPVFE